MRASKQRINSPTACRRTVPLATEAGRYDDLQARSRELSMKRRTSDTSIIQALEVVEPRRTKYPPVSGVLLRLRVSILLVLKKMSKLLPLLSLLALLPSSFAQQSVWGQCKLRLPAFFVHELTHCLEGGGIGWTGATTCAAGTECHYYNDYYSQCIPVSYFIDETLYQSQMIFS